jgi:hypothetical protein
LPSLLRKSDPRISENFLRSTGATAVHFGSIFEGPSSAFSSSHCQFGKRAAGSLIPGGVYVVENNGNLPVSVVIVDDFAL